MATIDVNAQAGADDDAKLTAAVAAASNGDTLSFTAKAAWTFAGNRTISKELTLLGDGKDVTTLTIKPTSSSTLGDRVAWYWNQDNTTFRDMQIKQAANASGHWAVWMMYMNSNPNNTLFQRVKFHNLPEFDYTEGATPASDGRWNTSYADLPTARGMYHAYALYLGSNLSTPATHSVEFDSCEFHFAHCGIYMRKVEAAFMFMIAHLLDTSASTTALLTVLTERLLGVQVTTQSLNAMYSKAMTLLLASF